MNLKYWLFYVYVYHYVVMGTGYKQTAMELYWINIVILVSFLLVCLLL